MPTIDEIVVIGRRPAGTSPLRPFGIRVNQFSGGFESGAEEDRREDRDEADALAAAAVPLLAAAPKVAPKVLPFAPAPLSAKDLARFTADMLKPLDEIIVTAPKPKSMTRSALMGIGRGLRTATAVAGRFSVPTMAAEGVGRIASAIARELSQQALDEALRGFNKPFVPKPDTPLQVMSPDTQVATQTKTKPKTFPAQQMDEITVTAARPTMAISRNQLRTFQRTMQDWKKNAFRTQAPARTSSRLNTKTRLATRSQIMGIGTRTKTNTMTQPIPAVRTGTRTQPATTTRTQTQPATTTRTRTMTLAQPQTTTRRSTALGIGTLTGSLAGVAAMTLALPMTGARTQSKLSRVNPVGQRTKYCTPCPRKKKKPRTKCYRQMVKQARKESNDKISKWAEINCDTGRTIKELI